MSLDDWILALHVLSAFALVSGIVVFWVLVLAVRRVDTPAATLAMGPLAALADRAFGLGMGGTIVFGVWLAISLDRHQIWDPWVVAALVLWVVVTALGQRANTAYSPAVSKAEELRAAGHTGASAELLALNRSARGLVLQLLISVVVLLILVDMIWKPGA